MMENSPCTICGTFGIGICLACTSVLCDVHSEIRTDRRMCERCTNDTVRTAFEEMRSALQELHDAGDASFQGSAQHCVEIALAGRKPNTAAVPRACPKSHPNCRFHSIGTPTRVERRLWSVRAYYEQPAIWLWTKPAHSDDYGHTTGGSSYHLLESGRLLRKDAGSDGVGVAIAEAQPKFFRDIGNDELAEEAFRSIAEAVRRRDSGYLAGHHRPSVRHRGHKFGRFPFPGV